MQRRRRSRQRFAPDAGVRRALHKAETRPPQPSRSSGQQNTAAGSPKNLLEENAVSSLK